MSTSEVPEFGGGETLLSAAAMPWRMGKDGEVVINWGYDNGDGVTLKDRKREFTKSLTEKHGAAWVDEAQARLDAEFELIVTMGMLT
jgi:hypothetical protein